MTEGRETVSATLEERASALRIIPLEAGFEERKA
jgi:hypothetical protein